MRLFKLSLFLLLSVLILASCKKIVGEGPVVTQERSTAQFNAVEVSIPATVYFTKAPVYKLELQAQQNVLNVVETYVSNNRLVLKFNRDNITTNAQIRITISAPSLSNITQSGSGSFNVISPFSPADLSINLSGSGSISLNGVETSKIYASVSGSGKIEAFSGFANRADFNISGSGTIDFSSVKARDVNTTSSGSGTMRVYADKTLDVHISGSGNVYYRGNPSINTSISGSGRVVKL